MLVAAPAIARTADAPQTGMDDGMFVSAPTSGNIHGPDLTGKRLDLSGNEFEEG